VAGSANDAAIHPSWLEAIADPVRLQLICALARLGRGTAADLLQVVDASEPTMRRHLDALRGGGIVRFLAGSRDGLSPGRPAGAFSLRPEARSGAAALAAVLGAPLVPSR
jgi:DNA-binding transcriptional ArsR family regulator